MGAGFKRQILWLVGLLLAVSLGTAVMMRSGQALGGESSNHPMPLEPWQSRRVSEATPPCKEVATITEPARIRAFVTYLARDNSDWHAYDKHGTLPQIKVDCYRGSDPSGPPQLTILVDGGITYSGFTCWRDGDKTWARSCQTPELLATVGVRPRDDHDGWTADPPTPSNRKSPAH